MLRIFNKSAISFQQSDAYLQYKITNKSRHSYSLSTIFNLGSSKIVFFDYLCNIIRLIRENSRPWPYLTRIPHIPHHQSVTHAPFTASTVLIIIFTLPHNAHTQVKRSNHNTQAPQRHTTVVCDEGEPQRAASSRHHDQGWPTCLLSHHPERHDHVRQESDSGASAHLQHHLCLLILHRHQHHQEHLLFHHIQLRKGRQLIQDSPCARQ